jgi:hypothetical protein
VTRNHFPYIVSPRLPHPPKGETAPLERVEAG